MSTSYVTLSRQVGLMAEMRTIANNIANQSTTGFRREGVVFSEFVSRGDGQAPSVSLTASRARVVDLSQGALTQTGDQFDMAIEGEGFFLLQGPNGQRLTRAGSFTPNENGDLATPDGLRVLDAGGAPIFVPPDARVVSVSRDGTVSADGRTVTQIGLWRPNDPTQLVREAGAVFRSEAGVAPQDGGEVMQGFLESANVNPVFEITRMIEVQRAYELGQSFMDRESERRSEAIKTLTR